MEPYLVLNIDSLKLEQKLNQLTSVCNFEIINTHVATVEPLRTMMVVVIKIISIKDRPITEVTLGYTEDMIKKKV